MAGYDQVEAKDPRPDDTSEIEWPTVSVVETPGQRQDLAQQREQWPEDPGPHGHSRTIWRRPGRRTSGRLVEADLSPHESSR